MEAKGEEASHFHFSRRFAAERTWYFSGSVCTHPLTLKSHSFAVPSSLPDTNRGGPLRAGQHELTKAECSAMRLICLPVSASQARTDLSGEAEKRV